MPPSRKLDIFSQHIIEGAYSTSENDRYKVLNVLKDSGKALAIAQRKGAGGRTALHNALLKGKGTSAIVTRLAEVYPEGVKGSSDSGLFPIHLAIDKYATVGTIKSLLDLYPECASQATEKNGFLPVHSICRTTSRPDKEKIVIVKQLLKYHPSCLSVRDKNGDRPIHLAAKHRNFTIHSGNVVREDWDFFEFLVEKLPASLRCKDASGHLPVHLWFRHQGTLSLPLAKLLIDAYPDSISQKDEFGWFPVHVVAQRGSEKDFEYLVKKYPDCLGFRDADGNSPLHTFLLNKSRGLPNFVMEIFKAHPALLQQEGSFGWLPIHMVVRKGAHYPSSELIETMISMFPGSLLHRDKYGNVPIHFANDSCIETLARLCPKSLFVEGTCFDSPEFPMVSYLRKNRVPKCRLGIVQQVLKAQHSQPSDEMVKQENAQLKGRLEVKEQLANTLRNEKESLQVEINELKGRLEVKELLVNTLNEGKESLQDEIKDVKVHLDCEQQIAENARIYEKAFVARLRESQTDIPTLKSFASMLKARLDVRASRKEESSANKPSLLRRMFPSLVRDPEVSRSVLIDCVEAFDAELTVLETEEGDGDECSNAKTTDAEGNTQEQEHGAASELPHPQAEAPGEAVTMILAEEQEQRPAKRARVSLP